MLRSEADRLTRVIVSTPVQEYSKAESLKAHNKLTTPDLETAVQQHDLILPLERKLSR